MKILLTGACGWLARNVARELESAGHELRLVDRVDPKEPTCFVPGTPERISMPLVTKHPFIKTEITDLDAMRRATEGVDGVIHLAAATTGLYEHGKRIMEANVIGTYVAIDAARLSGVRRFLCASSINAFGTMYWRVSKDKPLYHTMPLDETFVVVPEDPYSLSKYFNEETCHSFTRAFGMTTAAFRFAGVWTNAMYERHRREMPATTAWNNDLYQWVHEDDIAMGLRQAVEFTDLPNFGVYTLSAGDTRQPEPTMEILQRFRPDLAAKLTEPLPGRAPLLSITNAQRVFGYFPKFALK